MASRTDDLTCLVVDVPGETSAQVVERLGSPCRDAGVTADKSRRETFGVHTMVGLVGA